MQSVISLTIDPFSETIFVLNADGRLVKIPFDYPSTLPTVFSTWILRATKIEFDQFGDQLYYLSDRGLGVISTGKDCVTTDLVAGKINDFTLLPELAIVIYVTDHEVKALAMDGSNEFLLFEVTALNLTSVTGGQRFKRST